MLEWTYKQIRRFVIAVIGMTLLLIGIALLALPGPGVLFIAASLAVLAVEFVWARQLLRRLKDAIPRGASDGDDEAAGPIRRLLGRIRKTFSRRRGRTAAGAPGKDHGGS